MGNDVFQWCFMGAGTLARKVAEEILASGRHAIRSVVSRRTGPAEEFARAFGAQAFEDPAQAVAAEGVDAIYVVTPHTAHFSCVLQALEAGKPVLCEKPFTVTAGEAQKLILAAQEKQLYLAEAMWTWFSPVARQAEQWIKEGRLGEILSARASFRTYAIDYAPRLTDPSLAGGALLDTGVYPVTYLYRLLGKPSAVRCCGVIENGVDMEEELEFEYAGSFTAQLSVSMREKNLEEWIRVEGSRADLYVPFFHRGKEAQLTGKDGTPLEHFAGETTILNEFDLAAREIRAGKRESAYVPWRATLDVMEIMDGCREQMGLRYPFEQ